MRNTLSFIVRDGDWKEGIFLLKFGACTIENLCDVILGSEEIWNSMASYTRALLKSKKFDLDERSMMDV